MKSTGIVRKIDSLRRIVVPKEVRKTMGLKEGTPMDIFVDGRKLIFEKYEPGCTFCSEMENTFEFEMEVVCDICMDKMLEKIE